MKRLAPFALVFVVALAGLALARPARADESSQVSLEAIPAPEAAPGQESMVLAARLTSSGEAIAGVPVTFYIVTNVFGERLMKVGEALSDATGTASVLFQPTWEGDITAVARFAGNNEYPATQTSFQFHVEEAVSLWEPAKFGLEPVRQWLPVAVGVAVLAVLGALGYALVTTVLGIPAAAGQAPATQPLQPWDTRIRRPAPMGKALLGMAVLLAIAAIPAAVLIGRVRAPEDVSLSTPDVSFDDGGLTAPGEASGATPAAPIITEPLAATLVRFIETTRFDEVGQPAPGSAALPADVAISVGRVRVLDSNRGRILTVTGDGRLASILDAARYGDISLIGAPVMTALGGTLYVATQSGQIITVNSSGEIENAITPVLPAGQAPPAPAGMAFTHSGEIWLSDAANHRVLLLDEDGVFELVIGKGAASADADGFDAPAGLATDEDGNLYVADTGNGLVKKFSPMGVFLGAVGEGRLGAPSAVAVGEHGTLFVSDEAAHVVSAFAADGTYLGSIGEGRLESPHSVKMDGGLLYVMDRLAGLFVFEPETAHASGQ